MTTRTGGAPGGASDEDIAREIIRLERERSEAYLRRDTDALERFLPENFTFTRPVGFFSKGELLALIKSGELTFETFDRHVETVKVHLNTAVAFGRDTVKGSYKGEDISGNYRFTNTYVLNGGRWEVVVTHSSPIVH